MKPEPWVEAAGSAGIFLLTFVSEDSATLAGAVAAAAGGLGWFSAFLSCFLGIWLGDLGLYWIARCCGRPAVERLWRKQTVLRKLEVSSAWFARRGVVALVLCRFIPGTRLPTFLAAGLLRLPAVRFAAITGLLALFWVGAIFFVVREAGTAAEVVLRSWSNPAAVFAVGGAGLVIANAARRRWAPSIWQPRLQRWLQWEFWPAWLFYVPVAVNYVRLAIKYGGLNVPAAANPGMFTGGLIGESKFATLHELEQSSGDFVAKSRLIAEGAPAERYAQLCSVMKEFPFPFVLKPDIGQRGDGFKVIRSDAEAKRYLDAVPAPVVAQEYVSGPHEVGIFYYRVPGEPKGCIFAMTEKLFPTIRGDGMRTVEELIRADSRAAILADTYLRRFGGGGRRVLKPDESLRLVEAGNHAQGCIFRDGMYLWSELLEARIDEISRRLSGFYIGRYDIRYSSREALRRGEGFRILELNGAASEATSAYDSRKSIVEAYRLLFEQWELVFAIGAVNRTAGHQPEPIVSLWKEWRNHGRRSAGYPIAD